MGLKLFWVETDDHDEDWFVVATTKAEATEFFEEYEGYDPQDATAREVMVLPEGCDDSIGWASEELLQACGAKFVSSEPRVVLLSGETFVEGALEFAIRSTSDNAFEAAGRGRPNRTPRPD